MRFPPIIRPVRFALNPVLADDPVIGAEGPSANLFYTPAARRIAGQMDMIVACSAGLCLLIAWALSISDGPAPLSYLFTVFAFTIAGVPALEQVWEKISRFRIDIDLLMLLGAGLAAYIGNPIEGALLLFLFALSGALERHALARTQTAITALRTLTPHEATLVEGDKLRRVPLRQVAIGSFILVRPGEKVPIDGTVTAGGSSLDESAITGESIPRDCGPGDAVFAGTQNLNGRLEVRATKLAADTTLAKVVELVTHARQHPARSQRLIDRIGPPYSVCVIFGSVAVAVAAGTLFGIDANEAVRRGIAVLITASPCALIIATPVAYLSSIAAAASHGVLVKGGAHLEAMAKAETVVFDKTGTFTTGQIRLTDIEPAGDLNETETLRLAGAVEGTSSHPLASAVTRALADRGHAPYSVDEYVSTPGEGVSGVVGGRLVWIGRPDLIARKASEQGARDVCDRLEQLQALGKTVSAVVIDGRVGLLAFEDTIREHSAECVERLKRQGIRRVEMLTGDHDRIARRVSAALKLDGYLANRAPADKLTAAGNLREQHGTIVLVGDGINDAPALARADVGIAMGSMGVDVAMEAADIVLMTERIDAVAWLHRQARRTAAIVRQNLFLAIGVIAILSLFAALGHVPLPFAVIGHEGSTVVVAVNALRLLRASD